MTKSKRYFHYWGKSDAEDWHCLPYHCLDVGAVGLQLLSRHPPLLKQFTQLTGFTAEDFVRWSIFLLTLHDIGKFAVTFQNVRPDLLLIAQHRQTQKSASPNSRHDTLGFGLWKNIIAPELQNLGFITLGSARRTTPQSQAINIWMSAMTGHHGTPPKSVNHVAIYRDFETVDQSAASAFVHDLSEFLLGDSRPFPVADHDQTEKIKLASWWLSGFAVLCDWIGSNRSQFEYQHEPIALMDYWEHVACPTAQKAIQQVGLLPKSVASELTLTQILGTQETATPTPLQSLADSVSLMNGPQLFVLEDVTGAGKTEAALLLAQRLMRAGLAHGIYFGLPTMATANAMYQRLGDGSYARLFDPEQHPTLVLAHGAANLSRTFRESIVADAWQEDGNYGDLQGAAAYCNQWLADNRKKALLADVGIGTIDQALLGILPNKHQSLRMLGLMGKILLIDEVHACDTYMLELLSALLAAHAAAGGSAILLSATLPQKQRQHLINAFGSGLSTRPTSCENEAYPLLTQAGTSGIREYPVPTRASVAREIDVRCVSSIDAIKDEIATAVEAGQCVCWIRNTVTEARDAFHLLKNEQPHWKVDLFHARFALADRLATESRVLSRFGKTSDHRNRASQVLIATQVAEQSLDLDFDLLITDLVPIDLIIQRAGRTRRHRRSANGDPITQGCDERGRPAIVLHTPPWQAEPKQNWFSSVFPGAARVYPDHGKLWQSHRLLRSEGKFRMPEDNRRLIENVYGADVGVPTGLQGQADDALATETADLGLARLNTLMLENGYCDELNSLWWDEAKTPTRLGDPTTTVWLARWRNNRLTPWIESGEFSWQQSSLSLRAAYVTEVHCPEVIPSAIYEACKATLPSNGQWGVLMPLIEVESGFWEAYGVTAANKTVLFRYNALTGMETILGTIG